MTDHKLQEDGDFYFGEKFSTADGMLEMPVYYMVDGEKQVYMAVGEDNIDLMRDWAFEWLDIFGNGDPDDDGPETADEPSTTH